MNKVTLNSYEAGEPIFGVNLYSNRVGSFSFDPNPSANLVSVERDKNGISVNGLLDFLTLLTVIVVHIWL
jgi:hypothetical protein